MQFTPKSKEEIEREALLPDGEYDFEVARAVDKVSKKSGKPMIEVNLKVYDHEGGFQFVNDYLMESYLPKLYSFCEETKMLDEYHSGELSAGDMVGKMGRVQLRASKPQKRDDGSEFPLKNEVKTYGPKQKAPDKVISQASARPSAQLVEDDNIPF